jgi:hypothetical protein
MPAVLLEGGTIINREEELEVSTPAYRSRIAVSVAMAIRSFCGFAASAATGNLHPHRSIEGHLIHAQRSGYEPDEIGSRHF